MLLSSLGIRGNYYLCTQLVVVFCFFFSYCITVIPVSGQFSFFIWHCIRKILHIYSTSAPNWAPTGPNRCPDTIFVSHFFCFPRKSVNKCILICRLNYKSLSGLGQVIANRISPLFLPPFFRALKNGQQRH